MNNNNTTNIQESKICIQCMTFYANSKLGNMCSKCFSDKNTNCIPDSISNQTKLIFEEKKIPTPKINEIKNLFKDEKKENNEIKEDNIKPQKPIQVIFD